MSCQKVLDPKDGMRLLQIVIPTNNLNWTYSANP